MGAHAGRGAVDLEGEEDEIDLEAHGEPEFSAWRWADLDECLALIVPFKRPVYERVVQEFERFAGGLVRQRGLQRP